jgi:lysophospholipid acyltransferase (LPLAT)-like uncharacterized protein
MPRLRVDTIPTPLLPAFHAYGYGAGAIVHGAVTLIRRSCRIERVAATPHDGPAIECIWHEHLPAYIATCLPGTDGRRRIWMSHPIWYMRAIHVLLAWNGVSELSLGSTGHDGQAALERVIAALRSGATTGVAVDGPAGPARQVKRGALDMAIASGVPILPFRFEYDRAPRAPGWDGKHLPLPGSTVRVIQGEPLYVTSETRDLQRARLTELLSGDVSD